jgi:hypothetical protein
MNRRFRLIASISMTRSGMCARFWCAPEARVSRLMRHCPEVPQRFNQAER